jgi:hypothetical protein
MARKYGDELDTDTDGDFDLVFTADDEKPVGFPARRVLFRSSSTPRSRSSGTRWSTGRVM